MQAYSVAQRFPIWTKMGNMGNIILTGEAGAKSPGGVSLGLTDAIRIMVSGTHDNMSYVASRAIRMHL